MTQAKAPTPVTTTDALAEACAKLAEAPFVAVDTEFMRETTYWPKLCLVQAAGGDVEVLIDPLAEGLDLTPFLDLLIHEQTPKVFHAARQDVEIFYHMTGKVPTPMFDTQVAAAAIGLGDSIAYDGLVRAFLRVDVDKSSRFTDWSRRPLSPEQLIYALSDVTHLRDLYPKLIARLEKMNRASWVEEEMADLARGDIYEVNPEEAWRRLKLRKTTQAYVAALKVAAQWREVEAQARDVPRARVMKDDVLYEVALHRPKSPEDLGRIRGVPNGFERSRSAKGLLDALAPAIADPAAHAPAIEKAPPPTTAPGPTVELLKVLLRLKAEEHGVAARLIATVADLEAIAAYEAPAVETLSGWRRQVFGEAALALKRGDLALRLVGGKVVVEEVKAR